MTGAGKLQERVVFERRAAASDQNGSPRGAWAPLWECWAGYRPQFGGEQLAAGRIESTQRGNLTVRRCRESEALNAGDRVKFVAGGYTGTTAKIDSIVQTPDRAFIEFLLTSGGPT